MSGVRLPTDWVNLEIGSIGKVVTGNTPPKVDATNYGYAVPWVSPFDIGARRYVQTTRNSLSIQGSEFARIVPKGSVLVTCIASLGKNAIAGKDLCTNQQINSIVVGEGHSSEYVYYCVEHHGVPLLQKFAGRTAVPIVSKGLFEQLQLPFPKSLAEQQQIAAILTAVDDKLDVIARQISATQTLKQGLMQTLFTRGAGTQGAQGRWHPHAAFQDTELGRIPVGWGVQTVGDVCDVKGGKRLPKGEALTEENTGFPYIRVTDMYMGGVSANGVLYVPTHLQPLIKRYTISKYDIFISVAGTLGLVGTIPPELDGANLTENADKLTNIKICRDYLLYCLCSPSIQDTISKEATANAQPKLALERIRGFKIPIPTEAEQQKIADAFKSVDDKLTTLTTKQTHYQSLKRGLMQKLLTGQWRVRLASEVA